MKYFPMCLLAAALSAEVQAVPLFILAGQSNAVGHASSDVLSPAERLNQPSIAYYQFLSNSSSGSSSNSPLPIGPTFGPEVSLAKGLADAIGSEFAIVKVARDASSLAQWSGSDWAPTSSRFEWYNRLVDGVTQAKTALAGLGESTELAGMFWMQGEQDAKSGNLAGGQSPLPQPITANSYESNLETFIGSLRADLAAPRMPFFVGEINIGDNPNIVTVPDSPHNTRIGEWGYTPVIQAAQAAVAAADPLTHLVPTGDFSLSADYVHFDGPGQLALGAAFADAYLATVPEANARSLVAVLLFAMPGFLRGPDRPVAAGNKIWEVGPTNLPP